MKRQRGRGRKSNGGQHNQHRNFESNGPDIKIRGSASHVYDKYQQLARDASSAGDRIAAENYLQHAEHYFRVLKSQQQHQRDQRPDDGAQRDQGGFQGGYANGRDEFDDAPGPGEPAATSAPNASPGPLDVVDPEAVGASGDGRDDERSRRHRRRRRYEGGGGGQGPGQGQAGGAEPGEAAPSPSFDRTPST